MVSPQLFFSCPPLLLLELFRVSRHTGTCNENTIANSLKILVIAFALDIRCVQRFVQRVLGPRGDLQGLGRRGRRGRIVWSFGAAVARWWRNRGMAWRPVVAVCMCAVLGRLNGQSLVTDGLPTWSIVTTGVTHKHQCAGGCVLIIVLVEHICVLHEARPLGLLALPSLRSPSACFSEFQLGIPAVSLSRMLSESRSQEKTHPSS